MASPDVLLDAYLAMANVELGNGPHVLDSRPILLSDFVPIPMAPVPTCVKGSPEVAI